MRILLVSAGAHRPQALGGVAASTHELALELTAREYEVSVLCGLVPQGFTGLYLRAALRFSRRPFVCDRFQGYPVYRQWDVKANIGEAVRLLKPDVAIIQLGELVPLAKEFEKHHVPSIIYLHNADVSELRGNYAALRNVSFVANSQFTASHYREKCGIESSVIPPLFLKKRYLAPRRPENVTFINPIPIKGSDIAIEIAKRCPDIPFKFVEAWPLKASALTALQSDVGAARNISIVKRKSDMKNIYAHAKIVLIPSRIEETWGRVATEAQFNGIPVVAANRGGLPEAVGPGGVLLDPDGPIDSWIEAIRNLWSDTGVYEGKARAALEYARRPAIDPVLQTDILLTILRSAISRAG